MKGSNKNMRSLKTNLVILGFAFFILPAAAISQKLLQVEDIFENPALQPESISGAHWIDKGRKLTFYRADRESGHRAIWQYELRARKQTMVLDGDLHPELQAPRREKRFTLPNYIWSPDESAILLPSGKDLYLFTVKDSSMRRLTHDEAEERDPQFSPDGTKLAYLTNRNLVVLDIASGSETQLTTGGADHVFIGRFDWVYEEEFGIRTGFFWSPDGQAIAFWKLDETRVPEFPIVDFIPTHNSTRTMRYPKAGDANSIVQIGVVDVATGKTTWMDLGKNDDIYVPRIRWTQKANTLAIIRLNRDQNHLEFLMADAQTGRTRLLFEERQKNGWISVSDDFRFLKNHDKLLWTSRRNGWKHAYLVDLQSGRFRQITAGNWDVTRVVGVDEKRQMLFYLSSEVSPLERHLFAVKFDGSGKRRVSRAPGTHSVELAPDFRHFLDTHSDVNHAPAITVRRMDGSRVDFILKNDLPELQAYHLAKVEFLQVPAADGTPLNAFMIKPPDFDPDKKYPVLVYNYSGPGSQIVRHAWGGSRYLWHQLLAQKGYIVFGLDNRGTGSRGNDFMMATYKNLGELESQDQIAGAKWLAAQRYVDSTRIGIWGWSYGGYMAGLTFLKAKGLFKIGIAVAPVTDWRNYDTIYTERFMLTPEKNPEGYSTSSWQAYVDQLQGKLLLVHGSSDDNVHLANTMQVAYALQNARKPFDLMIYPRKLHGIRGTDTRVHLFNYLTRYVLENL